MDTLCNRWRVGDVRADGMVFIAYDKTYASGERWGTQEKLDEKRRKTRERASEVRHTPGGIAYRREYYRRPDVVARRKALRNRGIGKGRGKRRDAITQEQRRAYNRSWKRQKKLVDPVYKLGCTLRSRIGSALAGKVGSKYAILHLGCSLDAARDHIESQFRPGMTWGNHGEWHIDHIIPLASAKTESELFGLLHYTNLQPLWAKENLTKWAKAA